VLKSPRIVNLQNVSSPSECDVMPSKLKKVVHMSSGKEQLMHPIGIVTGSLGNAIAPSAG
jgi:hypothetical protein